MQLFSSFINNIPDDTKEKLLASNTNNSVTMETSNNISSSMSKATQLTTKVSKKQKSKHKYSGDMDYDSAKMKDVRLASCINNTSAMETSIPIFTSTSKSKSTSYKVDTKRKSTHHHKESESDDSDETDDDSSLSSSSDMSSISEYSMGEETLKSLKKPKYNSDKRLKARVTLAVEYHKKASLKMRAQERKISKKYSKKVSTLKKKLKMASEKPSTPPQQNPWLSTDQINQFVSSFFSIAMKNQEKKQQNSENDKTESKSSRGYDNTSRKYGSFDRPVYQKPPSPDFHKYRDTNTSLSTDRSRTPSPQYTSPSYGNQQSYDKEEPYNRTESYDRPETCDRGERDLLNEYGINRPYQFGSQHRYPPPPNPDRMDYWALVDCSNKCKGPVGLRQHNIRYIKNRLREAIGGEFMFDKINTRHYNWARHDGLCSYAMTLIQEYGRPLGKRQIEKFLTAVCPSLNPLLKTMVSNVPFYCLR